MSKLLRILTYPFGFLTWMLVIMSATRNLPTLKEWNEYWMNEIEIRMIFGPTFAFGSMIGLIIWCLV